MGRTFIVCERFAAPVILGCEFNDKFVQSIYPRRKVVQLDDGTKIPIVRKPAARAANAPPLPSAQEYGPKPGGFPQSSRCLAPWKLRRAPTFGYT